MTRSIVTTEIRASILRHRLFDRLAGRMDIIAPHTISPVLARQIPSFIVAGLDDARDPGTAGWPVFTGGRYAKLCFSPVLDGLRNSEAGLLLHPFPVTQADYIRYVETITGIGSSDASNLARLYRFDAAEIFDACAVMQVSCFAAWRLLLSNEFALAVRLWPALYDLPPRSQFKRPLIDAFRIVAELERASLIMRHLARARAILDQPTFLEALRSPVPLSAKYKPSELPEIYRWMEYAALSSRALNDLMVARNVDEITALPRGYAPWAIALGLPIGAAADFHDNVEVRKAVAHVFSRQPILQPKAAEAGDQPVEAGTKILVERRKGMLRNYEILRWYGMTNEVLPIIALDDVRTSFPTRRASSGGPARRTHVPDDARVVMAMLGSTMRVRADPAMQRKIVGAAVQYRRGSRHATGKAASLQANAKAGLKMALTYLPRRGRLGSAARFDPMMWKTPLRDAELWQMLLDPQLGKPHRRSHPARKQITGAVLAMRRTYGSFFAGLRWTPEVGRVVCDMAVGLSPISVDPQIAYAIHALGRKPSLLLRLNMEMARRGYGR